MSSTKDQMRQLIERLPGDCTRENVQYHWYVQKQVARGLEDLRQGRLDNTIIFTTNDPDYWSVFTSFILTYFLTLATFAITIPRIYIAHFTQKGRAPCKSLDLTNQTSLMI